jgi:hypothetical protein
VALARPAHYASSHALMPLKSITALDGPIPDEPSHDNGADADRQKNQYNKHLAPPKKRPPTIWPAALRVQNRLTSMNAVQPPVKLMLGLKRDVA